MSGVDCVAAAVGIGMAGGGGGGGGNGALCAGVTCCWRPALLQPCNFRQRVSTAVPVVCRSDSNI